MARSCVGAPHTATAATLPAARSSTPPLSPHFQLVAPAKKRYSEALALVTPHHDAAQHRALLNNRSAAYLAGGRGAFCCVVCLFI